MISRRLPAAGVLLAAAVLLAGRVPRAVSDDQPAVKLTAPPVAVPAAGRFQMTAAAGQVYLLDTATGQVWKHAPGGKTDDRFFDAKVREDGLADLSAKLGPTYQSLPLSYWLLLLRDGDEEFRKKGVEAIGHFGPKGRAALPDLVEMFLKSVGTGSLFDDSWDRIASAIARIDPRHEYFRAQLRHKEYQTRRDAALMICVLGEVDPKRSPERRRIVVQTRADVDDEPPTENAHQWRLPGDSEAVPVLVEMLQDRQAVNDELLYVEAALRGLASFKTESAAAVPTLTRMLADKDARVRRLVPKVLAEMGPAAKSTVPLMRAGLKDADPEVRAGTAETLGTFGDRESLPVLKAMMNDGEYPKVRQAVVGALANFKEDAETTVPILLEVLRTPAPKLKTTIQHGGRTETIDSSNEIAVVHEAYQSLAKLGPGAKTAVPELVKQARGGPFARAAYRALKKIAPEEAEKLPSPDQPKIAP